MVELILLKRPDSMVAPANLRQSVFCLCSSWDVHNYREEAAAWHHTGRWSQAKLSIEHRQGGKIGLKMGIFFPSFNGCYQKENLLGGREHSLTWGDKTQPEKKNYFEFSPISLQVYFQKWFPSNISPRNRQESEAEQQAWFTNPILRLNFFWG